MKITGNGGKICDQPGVHLHPSQEKARLLRSPSFNECPISVDRVSVREIKSHRPIAHVAKEIGVAPGLLGRWVKNERERRGAPDRLSQADLRAENARLRRELADAKMDNEFLSQATVFFAAQQREQKSSN